MDSCLEEDRPPGSFSEVLEDTEEALEDALEDEATEFRDLKTEKTGLVFCRVFIRTTLIFIISKKVKCLNGLTRPKLH